MGEGRKKRHSRVVKKKKRRRGGETLQQLFPQPRRENLFAALNGDLVAEAEVRLLLLRSPLGENLSRLLIKKQQTLYKQKACADVILKNPSL